MHGSQEVVKEDPQMEEADLLPLLLVSLLCLSNSSGGGQTSKTGEAEEVNSGGKEFCHFREGKESVTRSRCKQLRERFCRSGEGKELVTRSRGK